MTPDVTTATIELKDGRTFEYARVGDATDPLVLVHHGTPGAILLPPELIAAASERRLQLASYCRAGYGGSTRNPGRDVASIADDVRVLLDALDVSRFATIGWSGGGPHALACAALLPVRCAAALSVAGVAPYVPDEFAWTEGMSQDNVDEFALSIEAGPALDDSLNVAREFLLALRPEDVTSARDMLGDLVSDADVAAMTPPMITLLLASFAHGVGPGVGGWHDDDHAFVQEWGFDLASITAPVGIWFGDQDRMVPPGHGTWLGEHVPGARVRHFPDDGHISLMLSRSGELLDEILDLAGGKW